MNDQLTKLDTALANTSRVVAGITDDQWESATPCAKWNAAACRAAAASCAANRGSRGELDSVVHLGENELPGAMAFNINILDAYVHSWDIAEATGQDAALDPAREVVPETPREGDNFHAVVPLAIDAGPADQLLAYLGRRP